MLTVTIDRSPNSRSNPEMSVSLAALASPHLRTMTAEREGRRVWCVAERCGQPDLDDLLSCRDPAVSKFRSVLGYDGVALLLCEDAPDTSETTVYILRTLHATVPLYVFNVKDRLGVSWDFLACANQVPFRVTREACRRLVVEGPTISTATIIEGVSLLAGGQLATWGKDELQIDNPHVIPRYEASLLSPGAQVTAGFLELIASEVGPRLSQASVSALELSGGLDSSCVAGALSESTASRLQTYGLIHAGVCGAQQGMRRGELIERFGFSDSTVSSRQCRPFAAYQENTHSARRVPTDELYRRGIDACLDALPALPDLVLTGIGGDELTILANDGTAPKYAEIGEVLFGEPISPGQTTPTLAAASAVESSFCRADMFLSRNIWPLNPLMSPALVHFGQMLPDGIKRDRLLNKITLAKLGLSDFFLFPRYRENFGEVYCNDLRRFDLGAYFSSAMIHDFGILDLPALLRQHAQYVNTGACEIPLICFANVTRLEHVLRQLAA